MQLRHAVLACTVHTPTRNAVEGQVEHVEHTRFDVGVGPCDWYVCRAVQSDTAEHTRSVVGLSGTDSNWAAPHAVAVWHTRSVVGVGALDCQYSPPIRALHGAETAPHSRSDVSDKATVWYSPEPQTVAMVHTRSDDEVGAADSHCVPSLQRSRISRQYRSDVGVGRSAS